MQCRHRCWALISQLHLSFVQEVIPGDQTRRITLRGHNKWRLWERATSSNISCMTLCPPCNPPLRPPACLRLSTMQASGSSFCIELLHLNHSCLPCNAPLNMRGSSWLGAKSWLHFSICACHPCAGAMLIFSVSFQF